MSEPAQKQQQEKKSKSKINWKEMAIQTASFIGVAVASGFLSQAGGHLYERTMRNRKPGKVIPIQKVG